MTHLSKSIMICIVMLITCGTVDARFKHSKRQPPFVHYSGTQVLRGQFSYLGPNDSVIGDQVCFYPDQQSALFIPRDSDDKRMAWFCFSNTKRAKIILKIDEALFKNKSVCKLVGTARITINGYNIDRTEGCVNDLTELVTVHEAEEPVKKYLDKAGECR